MSYITAENRAALQAHLRQAKTSPAAPVEDAAKPNGLLAACERIADDARRRDALQNGCSPSSADDVDGKGLLSVTGWGR